MTQWTLHMAEKMHLVLHKLVVLANAREIQKHGKNVTKRSGTLDKSMLGHRGQLGEAKRLRPPCNDKCRLKSDCQVADSLIKSA